MYMITGSQAARQEHNQLTLLQLSDLHKTHVAADSDEESEDDDDHLDEDPTIEHVNIPHMGGVNRVRCLPQTPGLVASMADTGSVHVFDASGALKSMMSHGPRQAAPAKPLFSFSGHRAEGYALDWSPAAAGRLATGDCTGTIHVWQPQANGSSWAVDAQQGYKGHAGSVEDVQWSAAEPTVFASASADRTVRIWDTRDRSKAQITVQAHGADVNVISWNRSVGYLLASGSDDGSFKAWDLRALGKSNACLAHFSYHKGAVTSIEWAPHDESVLALSSADQQLTVWDLSVEADDSAAPMQAEFPPQLLFLHLGQRNLKELHYHPQIPGLLVSTAEDCFNIFKPAISVSS
jgi:ribosome assembly protein RRB1